MMRFNDPWVLVLLAMIPALAFMNLKRPFSGRVRFSRVSTLKRIRESRSVKIRNILWILRLIAISLIVLALARPQSGRKTREIITEGVDIILTIDTSGSMQALDFELDGERANRLQAVKKVVKDFIKGRVNDRIGMVVFANQAYTQCPLTLDHGVLMSFLDRVEIGMAGDGTAIGSALGVSVNRMRELEAKSKIIILLTDGRNNFGRLDPMDAAEIAKTYDIKVYTIGAGTRGEVPFLVDTFFGKRYIYQRVDLDEDTLMKIASLTGGKYYRATDTKSLEDIYKEIDQLEKTEAKVKEFMEYEELFAYFLLPGIFLILMEVGLANTRFRKIP